jgi:Flp pilus assembly protein TadG
VRLRGFGASHDRRSRVSSSGQSLTEFALVFPILALLLMGIIQLGLLFGAQIGVINGVREAARFGSLSPTTAANESANAAAVDNHLTAVVLPGGVFSYSATNLRSSSVTYCSYQNPGGGTYSVRLTVIATYAHPLFVPLVGVILDPFDGALDSALELTSTERFRVENVPLNSSEVVGLAACP